MMMALPFKPAPRSSALIDESRRVSNEIECSVRRRARSWPAPPSAPSPATPAADPPPAGDGTTSSEPAVPLRLPPPSSPPAAADTNQLATIIVTAQRRSENIQDVPISMQALTGQTMQQLNIQTFDDYVKYLPNVTSANNGPGQNEIFMRGVSAGSQASQGSGSTGLWPNVAVYLDDQSVQLPNRNLDVYAADLERIEVLEGPQGTLFGAGAQAGVIRYITNKPQLDVTSGSVDAGFGTTAHGDDNSDVTAVLNLPIIDGHMAVRGVIYDARRGGYIDNVPATFAREDTDVGIHYAGYPAVNGQCPDGGANNGYCVPPGSPTVNNREITGNAINPVEYQGIRVEALYKFNEDWDVLLTQSYQDLNSQGVFYQQPYAPDGSSLPPLEATLFNNAYDKDRFENTACDGARQDKQPRFRLHRRLSRPQRRAGRRLHQLRPRRLRRLPSVLRAQLRLQRAVANLLLAELHPGARWSAMCTSSMKCASARRTAGACAGSSACITRPMRSTTRQAGSTRPFPRAPPNGAPGTAGNTGCLSDVGTFSGTTVAEPRSGRATTLRSTRTSCATPGRSPSTSPPVTISCRMC